MSPTVVYVCDEAHAARLAISLESWKRFRDADAYVIDFGLSQATRQRLGQAYGAKLVKRSHPVSEGIERRIGAYREKTLAVTLVADIGHAGEDPIVLLDSDIIVFDASFFDMVEDVGDGEVAASASAWDVDFTWTYRPEAEPVLREVCGLPDFERSWTIPNSGVVSARPGTWRAVCPAWALLYDRFLAAPDWRRLIRPGASPGDQEFLRLALARAGCAWRPLHGSCNMQVSPERMCWGPETGMPFVGGHFGEPPEVVRALHYGVGRDGAIAFSEAMLANTAARASVAAMVDGLREAAVGRGWIFTHGDGAQAWSHDSSRPAPSAVQQSPRGTAGQSERAHRY
jgi:hypothetical protein